MIIYKKKKYRKIRKSSSITNINESVEKKRTGSSQKQTNQFNSKAESRNSKPSQNLQDDELPKKIVPSLILESVGSYNYQQKKQNDLPVCFFLNLFLSKKKF